jgi:hypothetical protein
MPERMPIAELDILWGRVPVDCVFIIFLTKTGDANAFDV